MNQHNPIHTSAEVLKQDVRIFAENAAKTTQAKVIEPAKDAARSAGAYANDAIEKTKEKLTQAGEFTSQRMDRAAKWVSANPLSGVGVGLAVGVLAATFIVASRR